MATLFELARRSQDWVNSIDENIDEALNAPNIEDQITYINRSQLLLSVGNDGAPLINQQTGSPLLSKQYAKRTGKKYPNIKLTGKYQKEMFTKVDYGAKQYFQSSFDRKVKFLPNNYPNMHGINKINKEKAYQITGNAIMKSYKKALGQ